MLGDVEQAVYHITLFLSFQRFSAIYLLTSQVACGRVFDVSNDSASCNFKCCLMVLLSLCHMK